jgi:biopolymer transport protein ExbB
MKSNFARLVELFDRGGSICWVLLALSIYVVAVIIYKSLQFYKLRKSSISHRDLPEMGQERFLLSLREELSRKGYNPIAISMHTAVSSIIKYKGNFAAVEAEIEENCNKVLNPLQSHLRSLELLAAIAPLLGLLGTVIGMVQAFAVLEQAGGRVDPSQLAGGIWTALLTTVGGLLVGIPAMVAYHYFDSRLDKIRTEMQFAVNNILGYLKR